jgi:subtilisin family serine protease
MDTVFDAQYQEIKDAFAAEGIPIEVAYQPDGQIDYLYQVGRLLARNDEVEQVQEVLPGTYRTDEEAPDGLVVLSIDRLENGYMTVPDALDMLDEILGDDNPALRDDGQPVATPVHVMHVGRACPATEPEVPCCMDPDDCPPCPQPCAEQPCIKQVRLGVIDTGLVDGFRPSRYPWMANVTGDVDPLGPLLPNGLRLIQGYAGHGTFIAGVAASMAPTAQVHVQRVFSINGAQLETKVINALRAFVASQPAPDIISLSAGTYTRKGWTSLGFETFHRDHRQLTIVAAAGNDAKSRPFYPAAYRWVISVGALGADQRHRAWFSNYGRTVDVYALGEGLINAFANGEYRYREPPKRPARQDFHGMARWSGTSFSTPLVAGLIASRMARTSESATRAARAMLDAARMQQIHRVGPVLRPCDEP